MSAILARSSGVFSRRMVGLAGRRLSDGNDVIRVGVACSGDALDNLLALLALGGDLGCTAGPTLVGFVSGGLDNLFSAASERSG
jgi:hypothetical protein